MKSKIEGSSVASVCSIVCIGLCSTQVVIKAKLVEHQLVMYLILLKGNNLLVLKIGIGGWQLDICQYLFKVILLAPQGGFSGQDVRYRYNIQSEIALSVLRCYLHLWWRYLVLGIISFCWTHPYCCDQTKNAVADVMGQEALCKCICYSKNG